MFGGGEVNFLFLRCVVLIYSRYIEWFVECVIVVLVLGGDDYSFVFFYGSVGYVIDFFYSFI